MPTHPTEILIEEESLGDGLQFKEPALFLDNTLQVIRGLGERGMERIPFGFVVHPGWLPRMADGDEVLARAGNETRCHARRTRCPFMPDRRRRRGFTHHKGENHR
jgi:hypothetical protein